MFEKNFYTYKGIADELNTSEATIRYWQDRFGTYIPSAGTDEEKLYPKEAIEVLKFIMEVVKSGMSEKEIVNQLHKDYHMVAHRSDEVDHQTTPESGRPFDVNLYTVLKEILKSLSETQKQIADAYQRIADAEERKAVALEKRAKAHWIIAESMKNIIPELGQIIPDALQKKTDTPDMQMRSASQTDTEPLVDLEDTDDSTVDPGIEIDHLLNASVETLATQTDEIADSLDTSDFSDSVDITDLMEPGTSASSETDDLSDLLEIKSNTPGGMVDDSGDLLGSGTDSDIGNIDNLFALSDDHSDAETEIDDLDNLLAPSSDASIQELDDFSELIDEKDGRAEEGLDDLTDLLGDDIKRTSSGTAKQSDLLDLHEEEQHEDSAVNKMPDDYKSKIIALIIQLKEKKGMSIEASTSYLNQKGYKTITGKEQWDQEMIEEIYSHINHVRGGEGIE